MRINSKSKKLIKHTAPIQNQTNYKLNCTNSNETKYKQKLHQFKMKQTINQTAVIENQTNEYLEIFFVQHNSREYNTR
ncbi:hypothetical protein CARUB_v10019641mg [Capsella rubella]|uniref:Uncharacterized protein n=1 Tax=Capsella rubella TaxID=81985 RepID=R0GII8_9BRAS|nr:hypothetical protein CARUB_v10019641mg [Capsella rubella]